MNAEPTECLANTLDVRVILEDVIEQVEHMTCSIPTDANSSATTDISTVQEMSWHSRTNDSKPESEKSKHRAGSRKNRVRYRKHKYKPYHKMSARERIRRDERDTRKAYRSREKMSASGLALAPYNTTQFLIDDQNFRLSDIDMYSPDRKRKDDTNSSDDFYSSPDDEEEFIQQQFSETYDTYRDSYLKEMSKPELVRAMIELEDSIERALKSVAEMEKIGVFQSEIKKLLHENYELEQENEQLQRQLSNVSAVD